MRPSTTVLTCCQASPLQTMTTTSSSCWLCPQRRKSCTDETVVHRRRLVPALSWRALDGRLAAVPRRFGDSLDGCLCSELASNWNALMDADPDAALRGESWEFRLLPSGSRSSPRSSEAARLWCRPRLVGEGAGGAGASCSRGSARSRSTRLLIFSPSSRAAATWTPLLARRTARRFRACRMRARQPPAVGIATLTGSSTLGSCATAKQSWPPRMLPSWSGCGQTMTLVRCTPTKIAPVRAKIPAATCP
mmetsp:Transcript_84441/g.228894  ORF Transcript_84441/g.228894 Transcript_84441/m.228894 type:complete len:249 (-) Transcript_84441:411-1157(-)